MSATFSKHLEKAGTICHLTVHDSPQSNGKAEWANHTIMEGARAMPPHAMKHWILWRRKEVFLETGAVT